MKDIDKLIENFLNTGKVTEQPDKYQNIQNLQLITNLLDKGDDYKKKNNFPQAIKYWGQGVDLYYEKDEPSLLFDRIDDVETQIRNFSSLLPKKQSVTDFKIDVENDMYVKSVYDFLKSMGKKGSTYYFDSLFTNIINDETISREKKLEVFKNLYDYITNSNVKISRTSLYNKLKYLLNDLHNEDLINLLNYSKSKLYELSFTKEGVGFRSPKQYEKEKESRIHNLNSGEFVSLIKDDNVSSETIFNHIKNNIELFVNDEKNKIHKYDIIADKDFGNVIKKGNIIEVKDIKNNDSYLAEPLASPVKIDSFGITKNPLYLEKYNKVIDSLYEWLNTSGVGETIIKKLITGIGGLFIKNNIYVPISGIKFYLSNQGQNNCNHHRRIAIRYNIKKDAQTYLLEKGQLTKVEIQQSINFSKNEGLKWCRNEGKEPTIIVDGDSLVNNIIAVKNDSVSEYVNKILNL